MSLDAAILKGSQAVHEPFSGAFASDPAVDIVKHAVRIWARDHGVAEGEISRLTDRVVEFACSVIHEHKDRAVA